MTNDVDTEVSETEDDEVALSRAATKPLHLGSIEIDFSDGESVAKFLETLARAAREKKRWKLILG